MDFLGQTFMNYLCPIYSTKLLIKGTFKDHLVTWVGQYLVITHGQTCANEILDDIDRRQVT